jgi:signal transduction histidine kinase
MSPPEQAAQHLAELSVLSEAWRAITATLDLAKVSELIVHLAATTLRARTGILRLADPETGELQMTSRFDAGGGSARAGADTVLAELVRREAAPTLIPDLRQDPRFAGQGGEAASALCAPLFRQHVVIGTLELYDKRPGAPGEPAIFGETDLHLLETLGAQAGIAIENARLFDEARVRSARLDALSNLSRRMTASLDWQQVFDDVVKAAVDLLGLALARVWVWEEATGLLHLRASAGMPDLLPYPRETFGPGEGLVGMVFRSLQVTVLSDAGTDVRYMERAWAQQAGVKTVAGIPLLLGERAVGVLSVSRRRYRPLTHDEIDLLTSFAQHAAIAIENARLFDERERLARENSLRLRQISILNEIGMATQGTMNLDALLQVILTGVTFGGGLGFNRAILLLVDDARQVLEGRMGVGPSSGEEASRIWGALVSPTRSLREVIAERAAERRAEAETAFDRLARSLVIPLRSDAGVLALTALEGRPVRVTHAREDPRVHPAWEGRLDVDEFACVPLVAKGKVVGVIVVDNKFNGKPITDQDLEFLSLFATQAGLAVESAQVYTRLEEASREIQRSHHQLLQQERLAALGVMAAHVVHEIRNPLVSIGGFARRLGRRLRGREPEGQYAQIIAREVDRLERIVRDVQGMTREVHPAPVETDLHALIQDCLILFAERIAQRRVHLQLELGEEIPRLFVDAVQVKQALVNLLANGLEAMPGGGNLTITTRVAHTGQSELVDWSNPPIHESTRGLSREKWVELSVSDTGGGIPEDLLEEIFNPFFTTKEAGTGLGLTLVHRIARAHGGRVAVDNRPGRGATFRLWLPVPEGPGRSGSAGEGELPP